MIKSMTGFGRAECTDGVRKVSVELKSVNHRYLDINVKMPRKLIFFETQIRNVIKQYCERGKIDVFLTYEDFAENQMAVRYHPEIAREYCTYLREMAAEFALSDEISVGTIARCPEVFSMEEEPIDEEGIRAVLEQALRQALEQFSGTRVAEGEQLQKDLLGKLSNMLSNVEKIEERAPQILEAYRSKLEAKVAEVAASYQVEESRLSAEIVLYADKICTDEEVVRLKSHIRSMRESLITGNAVGRKLDFIAQEMNREANTILSKANDLDTSNLAIELKTEIEKIREQIQNIE